DEDLWLERQAALARAHDEVRVTRVNRERRHREVRDEAPGPRVIGAAEDALRRRGVDLAGSARAAGDSAHSAAVVGEGGRGAMPGRAAAERAVWPDGGGNGVVRFGREHVKHAPTGLGDEVAREGRGEAVREREPVVDLHEARAGVRALP